jgi:hypothetical protein
VVLSQQAEKEAKSKAMSSATDKKFTLVLSKTKIHGNAPTATGGYDNLAVESMNASVSGDASKSKADTKKDKKGGGSLIFLSSYSASLIQ